MAVSASEGISLLTSQPSLLTTLHENIRAFRLILDATATVCPIQIPSHPASAIVHIQYRPNAPATLQVPTATSHKLSLSPSKQSNPSSLAPRDAQEFDIELEDKLLQDVVDEALSQGVLITRAKRLRGQEPAEPRPSIRIAITAALTKKEIEKAGSVVRSALVKVLGKRR